MKYRFIKENDLLNVKKADVYKEDVDGDIRVPVVGKAGFRVFFKTSTLLNKGYIERVEEEKEEESGEIVKLNTNENEFFELNFPLGSESNLANNLARLKTIATLSTEKINEIIDFINKKK